MTNMTNESAAEYGAEAIKVLKGLEGVRKRPSMYIGSTSVEGLHHLVYEVVDNSIDEALAGECDYIEVIIHTDNSVSVTDNGRGIPVDMHAKEQRPALEVVLTTLHAGGKFDKDTYKVSGGLHGVGLSVVNALSAHLTVDSIRGGHRYRQEFVRGLKKTDLKDLGADDGRGTKVTFSADPEIFDTLEYSYDTLTHRLKELAYLNAGISITLGDERIDKTQTFKFDGGIVEFVKALGRGHTTLHDTPISLQKTRDGVEVEVAIQYNESFNENVFSYVNNIRTTEGGTHLVGFRAALTRQLNNFANREGMFKPGGKHAPA